MRWWWGSASTLEMLTLENKHTAVFSFAPMTLLNLEASPSTFVTENEADFLVLVLGKPAVCTTAQLRPRVLAQAEGWERLPGCQQIMRWDLEGPNSTSCTTRLGGQDITVVEAEAQCESSLWYTQITETAV